MDNPHHQLRNINRVCSEYLGKTGIAPTRLYIGENTYHDLRMTRDLYVYMPQTDLTSIAEERVMGLRVFRVHERDHLFVC